MNIGIILAAGNSSRFGSPKQIHKINNKSIISYSIDAMSCLDDIIIVTNKTCYETISKLASVVLINEIDSRLESLRVALDYIGKKDANVIIHDAARPFITQNHIKTILKNYTYQQYYMKLVNGLAKKTELRYEVVDRNQYIELCTPQMAELEFLDFAFRKYIVNKIHYELLPIAELMKIKYKLIEGHYKYLRKITTLEDI